MFHSPGWLRRAMARLDQVNGKQDDQERDTGIGFIAGFVGGVIFALAGSGAIVRQLVEACANG